MGYKFYFSLDPIDTFLGNAIDPTPYWAHWLQNGGVCGGGKQMVDLSHLLLEGGENTHNTPPYLTPPPSPIDLRGGGQKD